MHRAAFLLSVIPALALAIPGFAGAVATAGNGLSQAIRAEIQKTLPSIVEARRWFHRRPELSNREVETGKEIARRLKEMGYEPRTGVAGHGVIAVLKGGLPGPVLVWRADIDALPITETTGLPYASENTGVMHACGHDMHIAVGLGTAQVLMGLKGRVRGTVVFLFQPAEETVPAGEKGGAPLVVEEGALAGLNPEAFFALHVEPALPSGGVGLRAGGIMASADRFTIRLRGKAAHGAKPQEGVDAVFVAAQVVTGLQALVSREQDPRRPLVVTVGTLHAGSRFNIIAEEATLEGTVRTLDPDTYKAAPESLERVVKGICGAYRATCEVSYERLNPVNYNDPALARLAAKALLEALGGPAIVEVEPQTISEDFPHFSKIAPTFFFFLGVGRSDGAPAGGIHTSGFNPDEAAIAVGVEAAAALLTGVSPPKR